MSRDYELVGGPLDGRIAPMEEEALRIGIPLSCENGCCVAYELYDWTEMSDAKGQIFYAGTQSLEDTIYMYDADTDLDESLDFDSSTSVFDNTCSLEELWAMWDAGDEDDEQ